MFLKNVKETINFDLYLIDQIDENRIDFEAEKAIINELVQ